MWFERAVRVAALAVIWLVTVLSGAALSAEFVPRGAMQYQRDLTREARAIWGLQAPIRTFAAQIHQESRWRPDARSKYALGLTQFTPDTVEWISGVYRKELGDAQPFNPQWAIRALARYDRHLHDRQSGRTACDRMAFTLSAYNGGPGWVSKDRKLAAAGGADPQVWFGHVEAFNAGRREDFFRENRGYPRRILLTLQPLYQAWGPGTDCVK